MNTPSLIPAPPSLWLGGQYISSTDIGREQFMRIMSHGLSLDSEQYHLMESMYHDTKEWFRLKYRRVWGRYFEHQKAVTLMGMLEFDDLSLKWALARMWHDTPEDTHKSITSMRANYGKQVGSIVGLVTNPIKTGNKERDDRAKQIHYITIRQFPEAGRVKVPDRTHNLRTHEVRLIADGLLARDHLTPQVIESARKQVTETLEYIVPIAESLGGKYPSILLREVIQLEKSIGMVR